MAGANLLLGGVAGVTIYIGLMTARLRRLPETARPLLALVSAGILVYLAIEVGYHAFESVESAFKVSRILLGIASLGCVVAGLGIGLIALGAWEDRKISQKCSGLTPQDLAGMTAAGIGVHNLGEGLAIGQSYASGAVSLGAALVVGFALHNATEGFGIVGALRGERLGYKRLLVLGLVGGGPTVVGSVLGGFWTNALLVTFCYALAAGSLLYVVRELLRIPFKIPARVGLTAVAAGVMVGLLTETFISSVQAGTVREGAAGSAYLTISHGRFQPARLDLQPGVVLKIRNLDTKLYTLEGPTILPGDVPVDAHGAQEVRATAEPGRYIVFAEENQSLQLPVTVSGSALPSTVPTTTPLEYSGRLGRQPVVYPGISEPGFVTYTAFNVSEAGEAARQRVLEAVHAEAAELAAPTLPEELAQYLTPTAWTALRPSAALIVGLGPGMYSAQRFGARAAADKPDDLHTIQFGKEISLDAAATQRDLVVRVSSDNPWFNQQVCRDLWRKLRGTVADETLNSGYATLSGRSPILGGFFDGTGNPFGAARDQAVYTSGRQAGGTYLALFKIRFDQDRFMANSLIKQQTEIGRVKPTGLIYSGHTAGSHQVKTEGDSSRTILRQGYVYDNGPDDTGLLFASVQASLTRQFEGILCGFMLNASKPHPGAGVDRLMDYMHFTEGGYYFVPPAKPGSYPGAL